MQAITEYYGIPVNWKLPRIKPGNVIRFWYWDSSLQQFTGKRGIVVSVRHLSAEPINSNNKKNNDKNRGHIIRGNVLYTIKMKYKYKHYFNSFYNQRMSNVEIVK